MAAINFDVQFIFAGGIDYEQKGGIMIGTDVPVIPVPYLTEASNVLFEGQQTIRSIGGALVASQTSTFSTVGTLTNSPSALLPVNSAYAGVDFYTLHPLDNTLSSWAILDNNDVSGDTIELKANTAVLAFSADSEWTVVQFEGKDLLMSDGVGELPILWDPATTSAAVWDPAEPDLSLGVVYNNRVFAAGDPLRPSRLYYSDLNDPAAGYAANFISIDPYGGSKITALKQYRGRLMIFKEDKIYVLSGRTPGTFALDIFTTEVGAANQKAVVDMGNDIAFVDNDGQIRTLATTEQFGDFKNALVTTPIQTWISDNLYRSNLHRATLYADTANNRVWMNLPTGPNALDRQAIVMDFVSARKFSFVDYVRAQHLVPVKGGSTNAAITRIIASEANEFLLDLDIRGSERKEDFTGGVLTSTTYKARALTPDIKIAPMFGHNNIQKASVSITAESESPTSVISSSCSLFDPNTSFDLIWQRDIRLFETRTIDQMFGSRLGTFCITGNTGAFLPDDGSVFILGASRLGGPRTIETYVELESSEFRRVAIGFEKESLNTGVQLHSITVKFGTSANDSTENILI
tara:strand:+ start:35758 stop:37488 length:1731 start_codon:yes stop_codon:yes gene_type:complete